MGKGRNKNKDKDSSTAATFSAKIRTGRTADDSDSDCMSESTHLTFDDDLRSVQGEAASDDLEDCTFVESLSEHIENASHKTVSIRIAALQNLQFALTARYLPDFVLKWKTTLVDLATKAIKKTNPEFLVGSQLLAVIAVQIGEEVADEIEDALNVMRAVLSDPSRPEGVRAFAARNIGITAHLACNSELIHLNCTKALADTWTSFKVGAQTSASIFGASLMSWCLLCSENVSSAFPEQPRLVSYVEGTQLEMRLAAGEALAFLYEQASSYNHRFANHDYLANILREQANDGGKSKTKRDKRVQKFTFRQIYSFIVGGESPSLCIKFQGENLELDSCYYKMLYDVLCELLRGGMMRQLKENVHLREIFDIGPPAEVIGEKMAKQSRMHLQNSINKVRDQQRAKQRDKRTC